MHVTRTRRRLRKLRWRFVKWRDFHNHYSLVRVAVFISTGHWQKVWIYPPGRNWPLGSNELPHITVLQLTPHVQLTLVPSYVPRGPRITRLEERSNAVRFWGPIL